MRLAGDGAFMSLSGLEGDPIGPLDRIHYPGRERLIVRVGERGGREVLDAIADTLTRSRSSATALAAASASIDGSLRRNLRLPRNASEGERDRILPPTPAKALAEMGVARSEKKVPESVALQLIRKAET